MKNIRSIIVDDEPRGIASLQKLLEMHCPDIFVAGTCASADEALEAISELAPQLVFLDIAMPGKNGIEMMRSIPDPDFEVIFVTAHDQYVLQALQLSAVDYLLKPVDDDLLIEAVDRVRKRVGIKETNIRLQTLMHNMERPVTPHKLKLCIPSMKGFQVVDIADIMYCEASRNYTNFHFTNQPMICSSKPIHEYEELMQDTPIVRVHKSYMINLDHVTEYLRGEGGSVILNGQHEIEVSRRKKELLISRIRERFKY